MIVLDASAAFELLAHTQAGTRIAARIRAEHRLHAPELLDLEVASSLRRQCALGAFRQERANQVLEDLRSLPLVRHRHLALLDRVWQLRHNFTAYDACYLALTEAMDATLLTRDAALLVARLRHGRVEVL